MHCLLKSQLQPKGSARILGVSFYAVPLFVRSGRLRGRSCNHNVAHAFWAFRSTLHPVANATHSEIWRAALSIYHCLAFGAAFQTGLLGSRCRNFDVRAWAVLVAVPMLKWWFRSCVRLRARRGRSGGSELRSAGPAVDRQLSSVRNGFPNGSVCSRCRIFEIRELVHCSLGFRTMWMVCVDRRG